MKLLIKIVDDKNNTVKLNNNEFELIVNYGIDASTLMDVIFKNGYNVLVKQIDSDED